MKYYCIFKGADEVIFGATLLSVVEKILPPNSDYDKVSKKHRSFKLRAKVHGIELRFSYARNKTGETLHYSAQYETIFVGAGNSHDLKKLTSFLDKLRAELLKDVYRKGETVGFIDELPEL